MALTAQFTSTDFSLASELDAQDELSRFRQEFILNDPDVIYLDGNSLGRLPKQTIAIINQTTGHEWGERLIRSWNEGWIDVPARLGAKIAQLIGAQADEVLVADSTSINLFKLAVAALQSCPERKKIVSDVLNFPSDLYILEGILQLFGNHHHLHLVSSPDEMTIPITGLQSAIDQDTGLVCLTHVAFKSAFMYDMPLITQLAHQAGALMLWDLCHSVGAVPLHLNDCQVDLAVGCTYKYLNGGPGSPAFLYVRKDLQTKLMQPIWGWFAANQPFDFNLDFTPVGNISRFRAGTLPIISMKAIEPALDILIEAGIERLRTKSVHQTEYLIFLAEKWLYPLGFVLGSPSNPDIRGSHVSLRHPEGYRINRALIESPFPAVRVIPDFRPPDNLRLGLAPIYTTYEEIYKAMKRLKTIVEERLYENYPLERLPVT